VSRHVSRFGPGDTVSPEVAFCDIRAERSDRVMYAEAKGRTTSPGLDVDTLYGQLLRRMPPEEVGQATFAVVLPTSALAAVLRVPARVRRLLGIEVYSVAEDGSVVHHQLVDDVGAPLSE